MDRGEANTAWYRKNRYLRGISKDDLEDRIFDILNNMIRVSDDAMFVPLKGFGECGEWMDKLIHCQEEFNIKFGNFAENFSKGQRREILPFDEDRRKRIKIAATPFRQVQEPVFLRYGSMSNMYDLYHQGQLMLQPAKRFLDEDLAAVQDDECMIDVRGILDSEAVRRLVVNPQAVPDVIPDQHVHLSFETADYAIYCMGTKPELRMIADWDARAVVIIKQPEEFQRRLIHSIQSRFPDAQISFQDVAYLDPYYPPTKPPDVCAVKHFRYSYQNERRLIVHGCDVGTGLLLNIGSITDIASFVPLE